MSNPYKLHRLKLFVSIVFLSYFSTSNTLFASQFPYSLATPNLHKTHLHPGKVVHSHTAEQLKEVMLKTNSSKFGRNSVARYQSESKSNKTARFSKEFTLERLNIAKNNAHFYAITNDGDVLVYSKKAKVMIDKVINIVKEDMKSSYSLREILKLLQYAGTDRNDCRYADEFIRQVFLPQTGKPRVFTHQETLERIDEAIANSARKSELYLDGAAAAVTQAEAIIKILKISIETEYPSRGHKLKDLLKSVKIIRKKNKDSFSFDYSYYRYSCSAEKIISACFFSPILEKRPIGAGKMSYENMLLNLGFTKGRNVLSLYLLLKQGGKIDYQEYHKEYPRVVNGTNPNIFYYKTYKDGLSSCLLFVVEGGRIKVESKHSSFWVVDLFREINARGNIDGKISFLPNVLPDGLIIYVTKEFFETEDITQQEKEKKLVELQDPEEKFKFIIGLRDNPELIKLENLEKLKVEEENHVLSKGDIFGILPKVKNINENVINVNDVVAISL